MAAIEKLREQTSECMVQYLPRALLLKLVFNRKTVGQLFCFVHVRVEVVTGLYSSLGAFEPAQVNCRRNTATSLLSDRHHPDSGRYQSPTPLTKTKKNCHSQKLNKGMNQTHRGLHFRSPTEEWKPSHNIMTAGTGKYA